MSDPQEYLTFWGARAVLWWVGIYTRSARRAVRGVVADLRWGSVHHYRKAVAMGATTGNHRESRSFFQGMNVLWAILAVAFITGIGATIAEYFVRRDLLGRIEFPGGMGLGISGLLVLASMAVFIVARVSQLIGGRLANNSIGTKQQPASLTVKVVGRVIPSGTGRPSAVGASFHGGVCSKPYRAH